MNDKTQQLGTCDRSNTPHLPHSHGKGLVSWSTHCPNFKPLPAEQAPVESGKAAVLIDVYEFHDKRPGVDFTVVRHGELDNLRNAIWMALDDLEDGETLRITYRKYTQEQMDEVYDDE